MLTEEKLDEIVARLEHPHRKIPEMSCTRDQGLKFYISNFSVALFLKMNLNA
jgi:hypothetical protein